MKVISTKNKCKETWIKNYGVDNDLYTKIYSTMLIWIQIHNKDLKKYFYTEQELRKLKLEKLKKL